MGAEVEIDPTGLGEDATDEEVRANFEALQEEARLDHGRRGYSGTIAEAKGLEIRRDLKFRTPDEAWEKVDEYAKKWGPAVAVLAMDEGFEFKFYLLGIYSS